MEGGRAGVKLFPLVWLTPSSLFWTLVFFLPLWLLPQIPFLVPLYLPTTKCWWDLGLSLWAFSFSTLISLVAPFIPLTFSTVFMLVMLKCLFPAQVYLFSSRLLVSSTPPLDCLMGILNFNATNCASKVIPVSLSHLSKRPPQASSGQGKDRGHPWPYSPTSSIWSVTNPVVST